MPINPNEELTPETSQEAFTARTYDPMQPVPEEAETNMETYIKYLYDKTQRLPEKPDTREEYFMMIAGQNIGPGSDVEPLTVTENGIYSEAGKAYSPVTVEVPLPTNANERKSVTSYPVTDSANYPLPKCDVTVTDADKCEVIVTTDNTITEDSGVYIERQSGGGNRELDEIVGGSIVWNQLVQNVASEYQGTPVADYGGYDESTRSMTMNASSALSRLYRKGETIPNHVYLIEGYALSTVAGTIKVELSRGWVGRTFTVLADTKTKFNLVLKPTDTSADDVKRTPAIFQLDEADYTLTVSDIQVFDLTALCGSTIADYIYSLEQSTAGSGIAWLKSYGYLTEDYYGYTANKIESVSVARHITRGVNQWDEQWESGSIDNSGGLVVNPNYIRSKNYINTKPSTNYNFIKPYNIYTKLFYYGKNNQYISYYELTGQSSTNLFTTPSDCYYMKFVQYRMTYNDDVSINYPSTDTSYHAYHEPHTYPINPITLRGIPKLNASNQLYYDGDVYEASGRVTRKYGVVDLGTLTWTRYNFDGVYAFYANIPDRTPYGICINDKYSVITERTSASQLSDKTMATNVNTTYIYVRDDSYTDAATFTTAMSGVMLIYEKATPTTESTSPFETNQIVDANGTEEYIDAGVEAGTRDVAIPVGHDTKYYNGKAYVKPLTAGTSDTVSMADMGIMPTSPMYIEANGTLDVEYWKSNS